MDRESALRRLDRSWVASAIYLVYLGVQSLRRANTTHAESRPSPGRPPANAYGQGFVKHLPMIRSGLDKSRFAIDRVFGVVLILFGAIRLGPSAASLMANARVAMLK